MKNILDFILSILGIILLFPLLVIVGLIILYAFGSPILFIQTRPGYRSAPFKFFKFRTMTNAKNDKGNLLPDKDRLTPLGSFLRKTSLDELPSLWNILKGDMSLVGPRPLLMEYLPLYSKEQIRECFFKATKSQWCSSIETGRIRG